MDKIVKRLRKIIDRIEYDTPVEFIISEIETIISDIEAPVLETDKERETRIKRQRLGFL